MEKNKIIFTYRIFAVW